MEQVVGRRPTGGLVAADAHRVRRRRRRFPRETVEALLDDAGWRTETFGSAREFLARPPSRLPSCLILDVDLPDLDSWALQTQVADERPDMPVIFVAGHGEVAQVVRAMKAGAADFLAKPLSEPALLSAVRGAIHRSEAAMLDEAQRQRLSDRYASLSHREREVMALVVAGRLETNRLAATSASAKSLSKRTGAE